MQGIWYVELSGCFSCLSIKECISLLWPIRYRVIVTCSFGDFWKAGHHSPKKGLTWNSLLLVFLFQRCCHLLLKKLFILGFRSVYGMLYLSGVKSKADFAAVSALSFPLTPMWLGIQQKTISLFDVECSLQRSLIRSGRSSFFFYCLMIIGQRESLRIWWIFCVFVIFGSDWQTCTHYLLSAHSTH